MALIDPCLYLQADAHPARSFRAVITEMWDEGLMSLVDFRVTQRAAGANFTLDVSAGRAVVQGDSATYQGNYMVTNDALVNDATTTVTSAPSAGNTRYDILILEVKDNAEDAGGINAPRFRIVPGTPAAAGAVPPALPVSSLLLATIGPIVNATTTITNSLITQSNLVAGRRDTPGTLALTAGVAGTINGWLSCDGSAVSRSTYARLFAAIGITYGPGNGSTTFNLPNLQGKIPIGRLASQAEVDTVGETGGAYTQTLTLTQVPVHNHSMGHDHPETQLKSNGVDQTRSGSTVAVGASAYYGVGPVGGDELTVDVPAYVGNTGTSGGTDPVSVMQPYQVVSGYIIRI